jgi:exodeoxyribonuclease VII small subunit
MSRTERTTKEQRKDNQMTNKSIDNKDFEQQLSELETLVEKMEQGDISLEDSLKSFEQGIKLARSCQKSLKEAELKVKILLSEDDTQLSDFEE